MSQCRNSWTIRSPGLYLALVFLIGVGFSAQADVFKWIDDRGVAHYTDRPKHSGYRLLVRDRRAVGAFTVGAMRVNRRKFSPMIEAAARRHRLEPALVHAVIRAESAYDPKAISRAGAVGLMQLMPATAKRYGVDNRRDPRQNIGAGVRYLRDLLDQFQQIELALAAYNAGENAVIRHGRRIPPYPETQKYVRKVIEFYERNLRSS